MEERHVHLSDILLIYKDPDTEREIEGYAYVWEILEEDEDSYTLIVTFRGDPRNRKVPRKYRKRPAIL